MKLRRTLYGLKQAPRYFFEHLSERIQCAGLTQSKHDPCLFLSSSIIVIVYVDDILAYARDDASIDNFIRCVGDEGVTLRREGTAEGFLGVDIKRDGNRTTLTQSGLTSRIIEALGLCSKNSTKCMMPAELGALPRDLNGEPYQGPINYGSIIGMLLYLTGHSCPDCSFAVHQCAWYTFAPKASHVTALKCIGCYLKGAVGKGLILDPHEDLTIDCYPDADFAGL